MVVKIMLWNAGDYLEFESDGRSVDVSFLSIASWFFSFFNNFAHVRTFHNDGRM